MLMFSFSSRSSKFVIGPSNFEPHRPWNMHGIDKDHYAPAVPRGRIIEYWGLTSTRKGNLEYAADIDYYNEIKTKKVLLYCTRLLPESTQ